MTTTRMLGRRFIVGAVVVVQLFLVVRGYHASHKEFAFQMFPESSTWRADVVRVLDDGERVPVEHPWDGYEWSSLVRMPSLQEPAARHHADAGLDNQLSFLRAAMAWVASHTPRDHETRYYEARVTAWHDADPPRTQVFVTRLRSP